MLVASLVLNRSQRSPKEPKGDGREGGGREGKGERRRELRGRRRRIVQMTFWRNGLEMTPKSPRFKAVLLFKMQTRQIETKKHIF